MNTMNSDTRAEYQKAVAFLKQKDNFLVTTHLNPDGDGIGSSLATAMLLDSLGKKYLLVMDDKPEDKLLFLHGIEKYRHSEESPSESFTNAIFLDSPGYDRVGKAAGYLAKEHSILNIDHHETNKRFASINIVLPDLASTAQAVCELYRAMGQTPSSEAATALYTGLCTDTGRFRFDNTNQRVFEDAAWLVGAGADVALVAQNLYFKITLETYKAMGALYSSLEVERDGIVAFSRLEAKFLASINESLLDTEGFATQALSIRGVEISFLLKEMSDGVWRVNLRSQNHVNVAQIAQVFGGGGHAKASGATIEGSYEEVKSKLYRELDKQLN